MRVAAHDCVIPLERPIVHGAWEASGERVIRLRKGDIVTIPYQEMNRAEETWGEDGAEFRPERWEENGRHGWEYLPFNGGPRICLGRESLPFFACI